MRLQLKTSSAYKFTFLSTERSTSWYEIMHLPILGNLPKIGDFPLYIFLEPEFSLTSPQLPFLWKRYETYNFSLHLTPYFFKIFLKIIITLLSIHSDGTTTSGSTVRLPYPFLFIPRMLHVATTTFLRHLNSE